MDELLAIVAKGAVEDVDAAVAAASALSAKHQVFLQLVNADCVYNLRHLQSAWLHASRAKAQGTMSGHSLGAEFLLYVTGERQVHVALSKAGIQKDAERLVVCAAGTRGAAAIWGFLDKMGWSKDPRGVATNPAALQALGVEPGTDPEGAVLERVALLDLRK